MWYLMLEWLIAQRMMNNNDYIFFNESHTPMNEQHTITNEQGNLIDNIEFVTFLNNEHIKQ